ncbi:MAG: EAL domain-containing protein [Actinomycetota bacterium]
MQKNDSPMYLPTLNQVIDRDPLTVGPDTPLVEVITLMGQIRSSCPLGINIPATPLAHQAANTSTVLTHPLLGEVRASCVFVIDNTQGPSPQGSTLKGIFTERDLVRLIAGGHNLKGVKIAELMSQPVLTLTEDEAQDIFSALLLLRQHRIRHLPIVNPQGELVGVVTPESIRRAMLQPANILKMRSVEEVMTPEVIHAPLTASVLTLAQLMAEHRVSCVVITAEQGQEAERSTTAPIPLGLVTERDIVQFQALELDLSHLAAQTVMSTPLICIRPKEALWKAHQEMQQRYVRRLIVTGQQGELLGILTQTNLLRVLDPIEMSGIIDALHLAVEQRTSELKKAISSLSFANAQLESEIATRERAEERLRLLESAVVNANDAIVIMDSGQAGLFPSDCDAADPRIVYVNEAFTQMSGYRPEEIIGKTPSYLRGPATDSAQIAKIRTAYFRREALRIELINYRKDGSTYWVELNSVPVTDAQGNLTHWVSVQRNVTDRKRMEQALFEEKELAQVTLQSIGDGVITTDASGRISSINPVAAKLTGWSTTEALGLPLPQVLRIVHEITRAPLDNIAQIVLHEGRIVDQGNNILLIARSGREFAIDHSAAPIHASDGRIIGAVVVFRDVTQVRNQARQLSWQATHDALTGLINRREFEYQLEQAINSAQNHHQHHALLYLDLDRFKIVNDTCGHVAGDELLRQISELFKNRIRKTDTIARLGGDEFAVLLYQCPVEQGIHVAESLLQSIQAFRFAWQDKTFSIGVSIGLVAINADTLSLSNVLIAADAACYAAKDKGRCRVQVYQVGDRELARARGETQWVVRINQALEENRFRLYYQSIVSLNDAVGGREVPSTEHYEVLLRLHDETGQLISPMAFIPAAERYNLMQTIDRWVIGTLFSHLAKVMNQKSFTQEKEELLCRGTEEQARTNHHYPFPVPHYRGLYAINLSGASINDDQFIDFLHEQFLIYQIPPQVICFEITETLAIANLSKAACLIKKLKELGCRFALDDFGSGMSSFAYLKNLPVDFVKIDGNFVKNIVENPIDLAMVEAINRIGHVMGIQTIAEYVENESVLAKLQELGVDYAQGYFLGRPQPFYVTIASNSGEVLGEFHRKTLGLEEKLAC